MTKQNSQNGQGGDHNWIDPQLTAEQKQYAEEIIEMFSLKGLRVRFDGSRDLLVFTQDRRVVDVPIKIIREKKWSDIKFLFRAIFGLGPSSWNLSADDNDWTAYKN